MKNQESAALQELFLHELRDIYSAEDQLTQALPKMASAATSQELRQAFEEHLDVTQMQLERLEQVFQLLGQEAEAKTCEAMQGLVEEGEEVIDETEDGTLVRDVGLIIASQKIEHYEIATYGSLRTLAEMMGNDEVAELLQASLDEEEDADQKLTNIAITFVNQQAMDE